MVTEAYPLQWPLGFERSEYIERSRFGTGYYDKPTIAKATDKLMHEMNLMGADGIIISSNMKLKKDGLPYSRQGRIDDMGIAAYFTFKDKQNVLACDIYDQMGCNLWAISKTVEAMRGIERWGCSEVLERTFSGFKALSESSGNGKPEYFAGCNSEKDIKYRFRELAKKYHPDTGEVKDSSIFSEVSRQKQIAITKI